MCALGIEGESRFEVSKVELKRGGPSYTADTLRELRRLWPDDELFLILGWDAASLFSTWHQPDKVREMAAIVVVARPGSKAPREEDLKPAALEGPGVTLCLRSTPDISASEIRRAVAAGESISGKVPTTVEGYIASHRLYAG
jgi:nicotinate-nucleotide adenylyltransferase